MYFMDSGIQTSNILFSKKRAKAFLDLAKKETKEDLTKSFQSLATNQNLASIFKVIKSCTSTSSWLTHSYYRYYKSLLESNETKQKPYLTLKEEEILQKVIKRIRMFFLLSKIEKSSSLSIKKPFYPTQIIESLQD